MYTDNGPKIWGPKKTGDFGNLGPPSFAQGWWFGDASYLHLSGAVGLLILWQCLETQRTEMLREIIAE